jgi:hypothetical protein
MATDIQLKRSITPGSVPGAANVLVGEPVFNLADRILYTKDTTGNIITISSGFAGNIASLAFEAANVAASYTVAGVAGNVSNIQLASGITTSGLLTTANISELTNLYFTNARARASISVASGNVNGKGSYDSSTGILSINAANVTVSTSAPINPNIGDVWIQAETATEYLFFSDGDTFQWVETGLAATSPAGTSTYGDSNVALLGYATNANVALKANVADLKTANVAELTNLYFTNARAIAAITNTSLSNLTVSGNVSVGGSLTVTGNIAGGNIIATGAFVGSGSSLTGVALTTSSSWTVTTGTNTYSITVPASGTYQIWVRGNIPNGIIAYNATAVVTNTNVPVVGAQYAWVYNGGGTPIDFTSIPNQFIGTANTIVRSSVAPSATTNRFDFGINNSSGSSQTVYWGYVAL